MDNQIESLATSRKTIQSRVFLNDVFDLYRQHAWLFIKLIAPAVFFGYIAVMAAMRKKTEIMSHLPRGRELTTHVVEVVEIGLLTLVGYFVSWLVYSFVFAGICVAVRDVQDGKLPDVESCFAPVRETIGAVVRLSTILFSLFLIAFLISAALLPLAIIYLRSFELYFTGFSIQLASVAIFTLILLALSRFGLAMPALMLDGCTARNAMFRSDELTEGRWWILVILLVESVGGSYLAALAPYWLADWLSFGNIPLPNSTGWVLTLLGIMGAALIQPNIFVGFALLYLRTNSPVEAQAPAIISSS